MLRVLVMDDEESVRKLIDRMITRAGHECDLVDDGAKALNRHREAAAQGKPYHAVILDLTVPSGMGGLETVQQLKKQAPNLYAIASSGYSNDDFNDDEGKALFNDFLKKPYTMQMLVSVLERVAQETDSGSS